MKKKLWKLLLPVPDEEIDCLILEDDTEGITRGFCVYYLSSTNPESCFSDEWYESFEIAQNTTTYYGLSTDNWQSMESEEINRLPSWLLT
jgi:hypothetical protein